MERDRGNKKGEGVGRDKKKDEYKWDNEIILRVWVIIRVIRRVDGVGVE